MTNKTCCDAPAHFQIEYTKADGNNVESMLGIEPVQDREFLHKLLDEWIDKGGNGGCADHLTLWRIAPDYWK